MKNQKYSYNLLQASSGLLSYYEKALRSTGLSKDIKISLRNKYNELKGQNDKGGKLIDFKDIQVLHRALAQAFSNDSEGKPVYLHELMETCELYLPVPDPIARTPEQEARLERLRLELAEQEYQNMTNNVSSKAFKSKDNLAHDVKAMDSQMTFLLNFLLTVVGAFAFGYKVVEYSLPEPNVSMQLITGVTLATIVFFADIYFIIKDYV